MTVIYKAQLQQHLISGFRCARLNTKLTNGLINSLLVANKVVNVPANLLSSKSNFITAISEIILQSCSNLHGRSLSEVRGLSPPHEPEPTNLTARH